MCFCVRSASWDTMFSEFLRELRNRGTRRVVRANRRHIRDVPVLTAKLHLSQTNALHQWRCSTSEDCRAAALVGGRRGNWLDKMSSQIQNPTERNHVDEPGSGLLRRLAAKRTWGSTQGDDLLHRDGTRHGANRTRCTARFGAPCPRERCWLAALCRVCLQRDRLSSFCTPPSCAPSSGSTCIDLRTCPPVSHLSPCPRRPSSHLPP